MLLHDQIQYLNAAHRERLQTLSSKRGVTVSWTEWFGGSNRWLSLGRLDHDLASREQGVDARRASGTAKAAHMAWQAQDAASSWNSAIALVPVSSKISSILRDP